MLKKAASFPIAPQTQLEVRSSGLEVPKTLNFEPLPVSHFPPVSHVSRSHPSWKPAPIVP